MFVLRFLWDDTHRCCCCRCPRKVSTYKRNNIPGRGIRYSGQWNTVFWIRYSGPWNTVFRTVEYCIPNDLLRYSGQWNTVFRAVEYGIPDNGILYSGQSSPKPTPPQKTNSKVTSSCERGAWNGLMGLNNCFVYFAPFISIAFK